MPTQRREPYPHKRLDLLTAMRVNRMKAEGWIEICLGDGRVERMYGPWTDARDIEQEYTRIVDLRPLGECCIGSAA